MKLVVFSFITYSMLFSFILLPQSSSINLMKDELRIFKELSLKSGIMLMGKYLEDKPILRAINDVTNTSIQISLGNNTQPNSTPNLVNVTPVVRKTGLSQDDLGGLKQIFDLMQNTANSITSMREKCDHVSGYYIAKKSFAVGVNVARCITLLDVIKNASSVIHQMAQYMSPKEMMDTYEKFVILGQQQHRDCGMETKK